MVTIQTLYRLRRVGCPSQPTTAPPHNGRCAPPTLAANRQMSQDAAAPEGRTAMKLLMLPPQTDITRGWARRLAATLSEVEVVVSDGTQHAQHEIVDADAV